MQVLTVNIHKGYDVFNTRFVLHELREAVRAMGSDFDAFWDDRRSKPVRHLVDVGRHLLDNGASALEPARFERPARAQRMRDASADAAQAQALAERAIPVGDVRYISDLPDKHREEGADGAVASRSLRELIESSQREVLLQTPYLVLSKPAQKLFRELRKRPQPPRVVVSSNSLAATDNPIVYALSYKYKRRNMRELGFNIFEYKPFPLDAPVDYRNLLPDPIAAPGGEDEGDRNPLIGGSAAGSNARGGSSSGSDAGSRQGPLNRHSDGAYDNARARRRAAGSEVETRLLRTETRPSFLGSKAVNKPLPVTRKGARMGLHAKSLVVDRRIGVVGTHNFDPRSENYNTEGAVIIDDPVFAEELAQSILRDTHPQNSWTVAPRAKPPVLSGLNYSVGKASEALPILDFWPWRYATDYEFKPGPECPQPLPRQDPDFHRCYAAVGDFPEVNVGPKWLLVRMLTAFGAGLVPIL